MKADSKSRCVTKSSLRRDYSRGGCRECKRRKIKCDEAKPHCNQCSRLNKPCLYPSPEELVVRASKLFLVNHAASIKKPFVIRLYRPESQKRADAPLSDSSSVSSDPSPKPSSAPKLSWKDGVPAASSVSPSPAKSSALLRSLSESVMPSRPAAIFEPTVKTTKPIRNLLGDVFTPPLVNLADPFPYSRMETQFLDSFQRLTSKPGPGPSPTLPTAPAPMRRSHTIPSSTLRPNIDELRDQTGSRAEGPDSLFARPSDPSLLTYDDKLPSTLTDDLFNTADLDILALDLNSIVHDMMFDSRLEQKPDAFDPSTIQDLHQSSLAESALFDAIASGIITSPSALTDVTASLSELQFPRHVSIDSLQMTSSHERLYLEDFFHVSAMQIMPFGLYDPAMQTYYNPIRDTILHYARKEPFLLAAVLAEGARTSFNNNRLERDQDAYCKYLSRCLRLLEPALTRNRNSKANGDLTSNIESILLTVLLLTSANASSTSQSWRPHLKGAKDIILRASSNEMRLSKTLILCKLWFTDFEVLAGTSSDKGGTLETDAELNLVILLHSSYEMNVLMDYGFITDKQFVVMCGYSVKCLEYFRDLIKLMKLKRETGVLFVASNSLEYLRLLSGFHEQYQTEFGDRRGVIPNSETTKMDSGILVDIIQTSKGEVTISWMDICQQAYCLAAMITIMIQFMLVPYDSSQVQSLVSTLISLVSFIGDIHGVPVQKFPYSFLMIQWPMLTAAVNCTQESQKYVIMKFFRISVELGSGSAEVALKRITRVWESRETGQEYPPEEDNNLDVVAY